MKQFNSFLGAGIAIAFFASSDLFAQGGNPHWNTGGNNAQTNDYFGTNNTRPVIFKTNGTERLRITETGFIGIDEPNPTERLHIKGNARIVGNFASTGTLEVVGTATFKDKLTAERGIMFNDAEGIRFTPGTATTGAIYSIGRNPNVPVLQTCIPSNTDPSLMMVGGGFISRIPLGSGAGSVDASLTMKTAWWGGNGIIEVEGTDATGGTTNGLLINYFCGRDVAINTNAGLPNKGGKVILGNQVHMQKAVQIGWNANTQVDYNSALSVNQNDNNSNGVKVNTWNNGIKAFSVEKPDGAFPFIVYGSGNTFIDGSLGLGVNNPIHKLEVNGNIVNGGPDFILGTRDGREQGANVLNRALSHVNKAIAGAPYDDMLSINVYGDFEGGTIIQGSRTIIDGQVGIGTGNPGTQFKLAVEGKIGAREVEVTLANPWPDYVFSKEYKLMPLNKLENFLKENKHLPNIPSAKEMEAEKGIKLGEMQLKHLEKTEELYLYIIELNKRIEKIEKENIELKDKVQELSK